MAPAKLRTENNLQIYLDKVEEELFCINSLQQNRVDNICRQATKNLSDNTNILINKVDKGSTVVVIDCQQYIIEGENHLNNVNTRYTWTIVDHPMNTEPVECTSSRKFTKTQWELDPMFRVQTVLLNTFQSS